MYRPPIITLTRAHISALVILAIIVAIGCFASDRFGTARNALNVFEQSAGLGFVALGQALVILTGGIDLSVGAIVTASTIFMTALTERWPDLLYPILILTLCFGASLGAINGILIIWLKVHPLIVTLGTASVINGAVLVYTLQPTGSVPYEFEEFAYGRWWGLPTAGVVMLLCYLIVWWGLTFFRFGRYVYAVGDNIESSRLVGIPTAQTLVSVYALSGFFAALAGAYLVSRAGVGDPRVGESFTLASITPVILGGTVLGGGQGGVAGTFIGVLIMSFLNNVLNYLNISTFYQWVIQGLIIIFAVGFYAGKKKR